MNLEPFEFTPAVQPVAEDPVVFTIRPLDQRGNINMMAAQAMGATNMSGMAEVATRYVVGWKGGGQPAVTEPAEVKRRLHEAISGPPNVFWMAWLMKIADELIERAKPTEADAKKF